MKSIREQWKSKLSDEPEKQKSVNVVNSAILAEQKRKGNESNGKSAASVLPDLKDNNRNMVLKKLAGELNSADILVKLKEQDPESIYLDPSKLRDFIVNIENEMYKYAKDNYLRYARERVLMLSNKNNQQLKFALLEGDLTIQDFISKDSIELESEETKKRIQEAGQWKMKA